MDTEVANAPSETPNKFSPVMRLLAWGGIVGGTLLVVAAGFLLAFGGPRHFVLPIATMIFGAVLVADCVLRLRHKIEFRKSRAWQRTWLCANFAFMGAGMSHMWLTSKDPQFGKAGIAIVAAFVLSMAMFFLAMLLSGASGAAKPGPGVRSSAAAVSALLDLRLHCCECSSSSLTEPHALMSATAPPCPAR